MTLIVYTTVLICFFAGTYLVMPFAVRWCIARFRADIRNRMVTHLSQNIQGNIKKLRKNTLSELQAHVIVHLVEPWLNKFTDKCVNTLASTSADASANNCADALVEIFLKKRFKMSLLISNILSSLVMLGWYLKEVF